MPRTVRTLVAVLGGWIVCGWTLQWLDSELPTLVAVAPPYELTRSIVLAALLAIAAVVGWRLGLPEAAATLGGSAVGWFAYEGHAIDLCTNPAYGLWRPCTGSEVAALAVPGAVLVLAAAVLLAIVARRGEPERA